MKKSFFNLSTLNNISVLTDILIPVVLYYAMVNHLSFAAWIFMGMVVITRLALVIVTK